MASYKIEHLFHPKYPPPILRFRFSKIYSQIKKSIAFYKDKEVTVYKFSF